MSFSWTKEKFFKTISLMFCVSQNMVAGKYGDYLRQNMNIVSWPLLFLLLVKEWLENRGEKPEVFHHLSMAKRWSSLEKKLNQLTKDQWEKTILCFIDQGEQELKREVEIFSKEACSEKTRLEFLEIFQEFLASFSNLSQVITGLFYKHGFFEAKGITANAIFERSGFKEKCFRGEKSKTPLKLNRSFQVLNDKPFFKLLQRFFRMKETQAAENKQIKQAIEFISSIRDSAERERMVQEMAHGLAKQNKIDELLKVLSCIGVSEKKDYVLSNIVQTCSVRGMYKEAGFLLSFMKTSDFREDAIAYILNSCVEEGNMSQAASFLEELKDPLERGKGARFVLARMVS